MNLTEKGVSKDYTDWFIWINLFIFKKIGQPKHKKESTNYQTTSIICVLRNRSLVTA